MNKILQIGAIAILSMFGLLNTTYANSFEKAGIIDLDTINYSSINSSSKATNLYDENNESIFSFNSSDTIDWIEYRYEYSKVQSIHLEINGISNYSSYTPLIEISLYRNNKLIKKYKEKKKYSGIHNIIIPENIISDRIVIKFITINITYQNRLSEFLKINELTLIGEKVKIDYNKVQINTLLNKFFTKIDKLGKEKALSKYISILRIINKMQNKSNTYYLIEYMGFRFEEKVFNIEKQIKYEKLKNLIK